jgi:hypothetical protein
MFVDINVRYLWKSDLVSLKKRQKIFLEVHDDIKSLTASSYGMVVTPNFRLKPIPWTWIRIQKDLK